MRGTLPESNTNTQNIILIKLSLATERALLFNSQIILNPQAVKLQLVHEKDKEKNLEIVWEKF